jgi:hypothetical protein
MEVTLGNELFIKFPQENESNQPIRWAEGWLLSYNTSIFNKS